VKRTSCYSFKKNGSFCVPSFCEAVLDLHRLAAQSGQVGGRDFMHKVSLALCLGTHIY
jgi:hypothetical protein